MASAPETGNFDIGRVFGNTFKALGNNLVVYLALAAILVGLPTLIIGFFTPGLIGRNPFIADPIPTLGVGYWVGVIASLVGSAVLQASLIRATIEDLNGRKPDIGQCLSTGIGLFLPILGISLLVALGVGIGFIFLVVPGIILWVMWSVAVPAEVEERGGVTASLGRSRALTKGSRWSIFFLMLIMAIVAGVLQIALGATFAAMGTFVATIGASLLGTVNSAITSTAIAATYVELRQMKEGASTASLAEIFA